MAELLDLRSEQLDLAWDAGDDATLLFQGEGVDTTGWVNTLEIFASTDNGKSGTGDALLTLTDGDGITNTPDDEDSEITIVIPADFSADRAGEVLFYRFASVIDSKHQTHAHGRIDIQ